MKIKPKSIALLGICAAIAMVLSYIESLIPLSFAVPGIKLGLANIRAVQAGSKGSGRCFAGENCLDGDSFRKCDDPRVQRRRSCTQPHCDDPSEALGQVLNRWGQRYRRNTAQHRSDTRCHAHHGNRSDRVLPPDSLRQRRSCGRGCRDSFRDTRKACSGQQRMTLGQTSAQFEKSDDIQLLLHNT